MKNTLKRVCIYPKDIQRITGKSYRYSSRMINEIKKELNREKEQFVTIEEFCNYTGISQDLVESFIK